LKGNKSYNFVTGASPRLGARGADHAEDKGQNGETQSAHDSLRNC